VALAAGKPKRIFTGRVGQGVSARAETTGSARMIAASVRRDLAFMESPSSNRILIMSKIAAML
jgi:hypothetical protein